MRLLHARFCFLITLTLFGCASIMLLSSFTSTVLAADSVRHIHISPGPDDVIPTGNDWIALPTIRAIDGSLTSFNALSMRDRGLLEVTGGGGSPVLEPYFMANGKRVSFRNPSWELIEYWIPLGRLTADGLEMTLTYCAPPTSRAAFLYLTLTNRRREPVKAAVGVNATWGALNRVTYTPVELKGERAIVPAPWAEPGQAFPFVTSDTHFAWSLIYAGSEGKLIQPPRSVSPELNAERAITLAPGESVEARYVFGVGMEEYSASQSGKALDDMIDRIGVSGLLQQTAEWCRARTRTTGEADLDLTMNRNFLFNYLYAWGRTLDTEQLVGVTSRSSRYYVSAAYWDRDAMLWSFPGLLDVDHQRAREALEYALTVQLRNTGTHSRFIDGAVLEDGFQLDEAVAPILAVAEYLKQTDDTSFLVVHREAMIKLRDCMLSRFDSETGLYSTLQDSQDQYHKQPFSTYDNVLTWKAMNELSTLFEVLKDPTSAKDMTQRAAALRIAIMKHNIATAPGSSGPVFAFATDGRIPSFGEAPPGSLMKLPQLGFVTQDDPTFVHTYEWLHSRQYQYSYSDKKYGLPGSYRLPFTTTWSVADHLGLGLGRDQALLILRGTKWDGGIMAEGVDPGSAIMDFDGRAFATAAGYMSHSICVNFCKDGKQ